MLIADVMTADVRTVKDTDTLASAARLMRDIDAGSLPVVSERDLLVGIITDRDITVRAVAEGVDSTVALVGDYMTKNPIAITPDADVEDAADVMADIQIRRLPVIEDGQLVGIVSLGDLAVDVGEEDMIAETLEEISEPMR